MQNVIFLLLPKLHKCSDFLIKQIYVLVLVFQSVNNGQHLRNDVSLQVKLLMHFYADVFVLVLHCKHTGTFA